MYEKKVGKRLLTWVLVLVMTLSLLPLNVLAAEVSGEGTDVVYGYDTGSGWLKDENGTGTDPITNVEGVDSVSKTAEPTGNSNEYTVTLQVQMHTTTETQTSYAKAATVLVIDTSGSMGYCVEHGKKDRCNNSRLGAAKAAAIEFLESYRKGAGRLVALVSFSDGATEACEWKNVSTDEGYQAIAAAINTLSAEGGTNLEQGLDKAQGLLGDSTIPDTASKNIIALTDGKPTYYNEPYDHSWLGIIPDIRPDGDGGDCDEQTFKATKEKAASIRTMGYSLYSICFGAANEEVKNPYTNKKISLFDYLNTYIAPGKTYSANSLTELDSAFGAISNTITTGLSSGTVHDSLPTGVTSSAIPNGTADWDLKDFEKGEEKVGDTTTYTYTKRYTVTIDPTQIPEIQDGDYYPLNGPTTLTVKDSNNEDVTIDFPIPAGKVTLQKYKVTYSWSGLPEGAAADIPTDNTEYYAGDTVTIDSTYTSTTTVKVGHDTYTFSGWTVSPELSNGKMPASDVTASGIWKKTATDPTYKVTYSWFGLPEGAAADIPTDSTEYYAGDTVTIDSTYTSTTTVKVGHDTYTFSGWDSSKLNEGKMPAENVTISGTWTKTASDTFTVTFNSNGGSTVASQTVKYNEMATKPTDPTRSGYTFAGWYTENEKLANKYDFATPVTKDITLYAKWTRNYTPRPYTPPTVVIPDDDALGLNTTDHFAYIVGYGNGEVRPQNNITRAEVATIFFRLLTDDVRDENLTKTNRYSDVAATSWYNTAVSTLSSMGIITGYPDGTFRPNAAITRAEFAAIAARFDNDGDKTAAKFSDIANHWAKDEISIAYNNGWITGYPDGTFGPQRDITRAETMTLVNRVLNRQPETEDDLLPNMTVWTDNANPKAWYYLAVQEATNSHYYKFKTNSKYEKWTELRETRDWTQLEK